MFAKILIIYIFATFIITPPHFKGIHVSLIDALTWGIIGSIPILFVSGFSSAVLSATVLTCFALCDRFLVDAIDSTMAFRIARHSIIFFTITAIIVGSAR